MADEERDLARTAHNEEHQNTAQQCNACHRHAKGTVICEAFPGGIPLAILRGDHNHLAPFPGDNGLLRIPIPADERYRELKDSLDLEGVFDESPPTIP